MSYHLLSYFALFLPIVMVVYQVIPKRFRFLVMLAADYTMYFLFSGFLVSVSYTHLTLPTKA